MERHATLDRESATYDEDVVVWADTQVALLRDRRFDDLDLNNIIEEIESVGSSQKLALSSQIARIIEHLLKLIYSSANDPRLGWIESVLDARREIELVLDANPSLRRTVPSVVKRRLPKDARIAAQKLAKYGELSSEIEHSLLGHSLTAEQVVGDWLPAGN